MFDHKSHFDSLTETKPSHENPAKSLLAMEPTGARSNSCPDCGTAMIRLGSCFSCPACGFGSCG